MSLVKKFIGFLGHHKSEMHSVGDALEVIASYLPIPQGEVAIVKSAVKSLKLGAKNIGESLDSIKSAAKDMPAIDVSDIVEALKPMLASIIASELEKMRQAEAQRVLGSAVPDGAQSVFGGPELAANTVAEVVVEPKKK